MAEMPMGDQGGKTTDSGAFSEFSANAGIIKSCFHDKWIPIFLLSQGCKTLRTLMIPSGINA
jgi:hypothetical protein